MSSGLSRSSLQGHFVMAGLVSGDLRFTKAGYEDRDMRATENAILDVPMQKFIRLQAGASVESFVTPNDINYEVAPGEFCISCKRIRLALTDDGIVDLRLTWAEPRSQLDLWVNGQKFSARGGSREVSATVALASGEVFAYVGGAVTMFSYAGNHVGFRLTASSER